jgi:hypothetical protein
VEFWTNTVGLKATYASPEFTFLDGGAVALVLSLTAEPVFDASKTEVVFEVEDVLASFREMSDRGVPFEVEPRKVTSDGTRDLMAAHFRDPDGHYGSLSGWVAADSE